MNGKNFLKLIKSLLLILAVSLFIACKTCPEPIHVVYERPELPVYPGLTWIDIPGFYGLDENNTDFTDLQEFFDQYDDYKIKIDSLLKLYEKNTL